MVSEKLLQKLLNKADFEIISPRFINWYQLRECWQFTKQLRRIYDSTLDRRPLSGKVIWRKISELKKTDVKWLQMSQKRKSEKEGNMSENFGYLRLWWDWISCDLSVPLNSGQVIWLLSFPIHVLYWIFWNSYVYFFNDGKWCAFFVEQKQSHIIKLNDTTTVFDVVGMHDRDK